MRVEGRRGGLGREVCVQRRVEKCNRRLVVPGSAGSVELESI